MSRPRDLQPGDITRPFARTAAALTVLSAAGHVWQHVAGPRSLRSLVKFFDVNRERNLPTWFRAMSLALCAALLWTIGSDHARRRLRYARHWQALGLVFLYLMADELFKLYERTIEPVRDALALPPVLELYVWVVPGVAFLGAVGLLFARFFLHLPPPTRYGCIAAGALYVGGAMGMELVAGTYHVRHGYGTPTYFALAHLEELLEMAGVILFAHVLLSYAQRTLPAGLASLTRGRGHPADAPISAPEATDRPAARVPR